MSLACLDGVIGPAGATLIPVTDEGLVRGDGIFEVIRLYDGRPYKLEEHLARLARSGRGLRLAVDVDAVRADLEALLTATGEFSDEVNGQLRIMLTRGGRRILITEPLHRLPEHARVASIQYQPTLVLDQIKSLSYGANMLCTRLAVERGFDDALLVDPSGVVLEAPTKSVFWVKDRQLATTPLSAHVLASITRATVIELAEVEERSITLEELLAADEVFLASTTREVQTVVAVDDTTFVADGPVTTRVRELVAQHIEVWRATA
ncbi:MAG: aminotransferase class IV [Solirubrobacterales bacterium]|nr:aminotransferase class IV [Solirubrobacterales bacterium]